jgi:hypothetical protein
VVINPGGPPVFKLQKKIGRRRLINNGVLINPDLTLYILCCRAGKDLKMLIWGDDLRLFHPDPDDGLLEKSQHKPPCPTMCGVEVEPTKTGM